jgi:predicted dinucleotide-binding enzyme
VPESVVVIDTGNYYPRQRGGRIDAIENSTPESQWVAQQLGRPVIKAFKQYLCLWFLKTFLAKANVLP